MERLLIAAARVRPQASEWEWEWERCRLVQLTLRISATKSVCCMCLHVPYAAGCCAASRDTYLRLYNFSDSIINCYCYPKVYAIGSLNILCIFEYVNAAYVRALSAYTYFALMNLYVYTHVVRRTSYMSYARYTQYGLSML